jgi:hypothetical protein
MRFIGSSLVVGAPSFGSLHSLNTLKLRPFLDRSWDRLWLTHHLIALARALPGIHILEIKGTSAGGAC